MSGRLEQKPGCVLHTHSLFSDQIVVIRLLSDYCQIVMKCGCVEMVIEHEVQPSALLSGSVQV